MLSSKQEKSNQSAAVVATSMMASSTTSPDLAALSSSALATSSFSESDDVTYDGAESFRGSAISSISGSVVNSGNSTPVLGLRRVRGRSDADQKKDSMDRLPVGLPLSSREPERDKLMSLEPTSTRAASSDSVARLRSGSAGASRLVLPKLSIPKASPAQKPRASRGHMRSNSQGDTGSMIQHPSVSALAISGGPFGMSPSASVDDLSSAQSSSSGGGLSAGESACEEMTSLARGLGETYMATDLTGLLSIKKLLAERGVQPTNPKRAQLEKVDSGILDDARGAGAKMVASDSKYNYYMIKNYVLQTLAVIASYPELRQHMRSPVNLLLSELLMRGVQTDPTFHKLLYTVLGHWADYAESVHRYASGFSSLCSLLHTLNLWLSQGTISLTYT